MRRVVSAPLLATCLLGAACTTDVQVARQDSASLSAQERLGLTDGEVARILALLNDCATDLSLLDDSVGLDSDAASALVEHRDGPDGACGTDDDAPYTTLDEVDEVPQVGDKTILAVLEWIVAGSEGGGTWEGVDFTAEEVEIVLEIANEATEPQLDDDVGLASDAAANIVAARPLADMGALAEVPQIGASSLEKLRDYVPNWR